MKNYKFASIDIGSNAVRLLFCNVLELADEKVQFKKSSLIRVPLRLGENAFTKGYLDQEKLQKLSKCISAFKNLIDINEVVGYKAFATSAMRNCSNKEEVIEKIYKETDVLIQLISGTEEAEIISSTNIPRELSTENEILYMDVGGGSTELTYKREDFTSNRSFPIGTLRILYNKPIQSQWEEISRWLKMNRLIDSKIKMIGSGGNINKIYKIHRKKNSDRFFSSEEIPEFIEKVKKMSFEERMVKLNLNADRADVILPASQIFDFVLQKTKTEIIFVPKSGLSDGIVRKLYYAYKNVKFSKDSL